MGTEDESLTNVNKFLSRLHYIFINLDKSHHLLKDIKDEIGILKEFFRLHNGKIEKIRVYVTAWEKGIIKDLQEDVVDVIYKLNKKISPALSRLIRLEDRDLIILKVITASRGVQRRKIPKQFILKLKDLFTKLEDNIKFLRSIIAKQNEYIRNNNLWGGRLVQEIEKHAGFYMLLATESNTDNTIRQILGNITEFIDEEFRLQERFKISEHRFTEEILNPSSLAFTKYYEDLYSKSFPKEELDSKTWLGTYARVSYQLKHILEHHSRTHLIVIKQGEQIVGGILVEFLSVKVEQIIEALRKKNRFSEMVSTAVIKEIGSTKEKIGFGVIWYTITEKESRLKGIGSTLVEHAKKILKNKQPRLKSGYS